MKASAVLVKLEQEQKILSKNVVIKDTFSLSDMNMIGGVCQRVVGNRVYSGMVICDAKTLEVVEQKHASEKTKLSYVSGFRSYREGPAISKVYSKIEHKPDVLMFYGNGILHPLRIGLASHMGLLLDQVTMGVAKSLLCGEEKNEKIYLDGKVVGASIRTKPHANPVYVSPGHNITLRTSLAIVKQSVKLPHKLPEPLHQAYRYAKQVAMKEK